jgi:VIT1/CCC1 family predicted Fe2+/Mn2+ transporter
VSSSGELYHCDRPLPDVRWSPAIPRASAEPGREGWARALPPLYTSRADSYISQPLRAGLVMFLSFVMGAAVPLAPLALRGGSSALLLS